jgi:prephenate dehydrogenase
MGFLMPLDGNRLPVVPPGTSGAEPVFQKIAIIGVGLMGASLGLAARRAWPTSLVIGVDRNDVLETAMRLHAIDVGADDPVVAAEADLVVLGAPLGACLTLLDGLADDVPGFAVVTDLCASKRAIVGAARGLPPRLTFVGGHPLAGAPRSGIEFARDDLYVGRPWILTPVSSPPEHVGRLSRFVQGVGGRPVIQTPEQHDHLLAYLEHLPQLVVNALMQVIGETVGESGLALAGKGLSDTTRLASSSADVWADVLTANADEIGQALDLVRDLLGSLRSSLTRRDDIDRLFETANLWRQRLPAASPKDERVARPAAVEPPTP